MQLKLQSESSRKRQVRNLLTMFSSQILSLASIIDTNKREGVMRCIHYLELG